MIDAQLANLPHQHQLEYEVRTRRKVVLARKTEAELVSSWSSVAGGPTADTTDGEVQEALVRRL